jgi:O-antigen/teichoic acid export membrane protein
MYQSLTLEPARCAIARALPGMADSLQQRLAAASARLRPLLRWRSHDVSTEVGRAQERHRRVALTAAASALAKIISVSTALISVPLTLHYLGPERYGLWMTISSLVAILSFADLGIGNGMLNAIAAAHGRDDRAAVQRFVSSGFYVLSAVAMALLVIFAVAYRHVPWPALFNVQTPLAQQEVGPAVAVFFACFALAIPVAIVQRVQMGLQRGFLASLWQCLASVLGLIGVVFAIHQQAGLPWLVLAFMGAPLLASAFNSALFFGRMQPEIAPARHAATRDTSLLLLRTGGLFLVLQLVAAVAYASDGFIIAHLLGQPAVAEFAVPERLFGLITVVLAMVLAPLWPAYGEAIARGDATWVRHTLRRSIVIAVSMSAVASFSLVLLGPWLIDAWVGKAVVPSLLLLLGLAAWKTVEAGGNALAVFLNGAHVVKAQVVMALCTAVVALGLKIVLVKMVGVAGAVLATTLAYLLFTALPTIFLLPRIVKGLKSQEATS